MRRPVDESPDVTFPPVPLPVRTILTFLVALMVPVVVIGIMQRDADDPGSLRLMLLFLVVPGALAAIATVALAFAKRAPVAWMVGAGAGVWALSAVGLGASSLGVPNGFSIGEWALMGLVVLPLVLALGVIVGVAVWAIGCAVWALVQLGWRGWHSGWAMAAVLTIVIGVTTVTSWAALDVQPRGPNACPSVNGPDACAAGARAAVVIGVPRADVTVRSTPLLWVTRGTLAVGAAYVLAFGVAERRSRRGSR